ncbi:hypothetical protein [Pelagibius sp. Alg239-R121]|uniref:hypothetical protein n=1 Tax=Pelagibius sp. Alg239-R121 TaxID=2993448 RepID=UPI0024A757E9|nr:hypothetical protein [Pelagibius sp. Alg239-R121]
MYRLGRLWRFLVYLGLIVLSGLAKCGFGSPDVQRLLSFFRSLGKEDRQIFFVHVVRALKQIGLKKDGIARTLIKPIDECLVRKSDRVFILGSGPSINKLLQSDFDQISKDDSWGLNLWFVHDFVPGFYFTQLGKKTVRGAAVMDLLDDMFLKVASKYKDTKFIIKGGDFQHGYEIFETDGFKKFAKSGHTSISVLPVLLIPKGVQNDPLTLFDDLRRAALLSHGSGVCPPVPQIRNSIGLLIMLAVQMGYKEIVLCGVDGKSNDHFYDQEKYLEAFPELSALQKYYTSDVHSHSIPDKTTGLSSLDYIVEVAEYCEKSFGVRTKIASDDSYLSGKLPLHGFEDQERPIPHTMP